MNFHKNRLKASGDMDGTRNSRVNLLTLTCDIEVESR